jgi:hypothetical protein
VEILQPLIRREQHKWKGKRMVECEAGWKEVLESNESGL